MDARRFGHAARAWHAAVVPIAIAHRAPSSAARCAKLLELGVTVFEVDVQSLGGELVSSHFLSPWPAFPRLRRDRWALTLGRHRREIALRAAAAAIPAQARILLDLKIDRGPGAHALAAAVVGAGLDPDRFIVCTKGWDTLPLLREHGLPTWRTVGDPAALHAVLATPVPDVAVTVHHELLTAPVIAELHAAGTTVMAWTVNDLTCARRLVEDGVDGVTSDSPAVLRAVAAAR